MIVALAGGVGGAKLAHGLYQVLPPETLTVVVNTADDLDLFGLRMCPDADTVMYTLARLANPATGWGVVDESWQTLALLERYGHQIWFRVGDRDFATHIARSEQLRAGRTLSEVFSSMARALGVQAALLPMSDTPVATMVATPAGLLPFQDYFVRRQHRDPVDGVSFAGIEAATVPAAVTAALQQATAIVFCPSNPIVSIGPILAVPGLAEQLRQTHAPRIAISPIVGGKALRGPADQMLVGLGHEASALGVARLYQGLLDGFVIDTQDAAQQDAIEALGMRVLVTDTIMSDVEDRRRLAEAVLAFARS